MRILTLVSGDLCAGAEAVVFQLSKGLKVQRDIENMVACLNHGRLSSLLIDSGVPTVVIDERIHSFIKIISILSETARKFKPDIIHAHRYKENILAVLISPFCCFPQLISTIHGKTEVNKSMGRRLMYKVEEFFLKYNYSKVVAVSRELEHFLVTCRRLSPRKVLTIHNGLEIPIRSRYVHNLDTITIGSAGRLVPIKDFNLMVEIARIICKERKNVKFILAGDGPDREHIIEKIKSYGLDDRFILAGHIQNMSSFYSMIDIYLNTSIHEGIPMTILEAMSYGLIVVAPQVGGIGEIIVNDEIGLIVKDRSIDSFVRVLNELIEMPDKINKIGSLAKRHVEKYYSNKSMVKAYAHIYKETMTLGVGT